MNGSLMNAIVQQQDELKLRQRDNARRALQPLQKR
jgi:hypothetical protein